MRFLKKYKGEITTFLCTVFIYIFVFYICGIFKNSFIRSDLKSQMIPLFEFLKLFIKGKVGLYSFNFGFGDTVLGSLYYYLISPFNILVFLIKNYDILVICIVILKAAFSSLFCYKFLKYQFDKTNFLYLSVFSLLYGLSSYFVSYYLFVQFLDIYMIFPLLLLGILKIVKENKYTLYVVCLMLCILFNYYFIFMICIFVFLYFNYQILLDKMSAKKILNANFKFIFISFLACLSMSFILLPIVFEIGNYSRDLTGFFGGKPLKLLFNFSDFIQHYIFGDFINVSIINSKSFYLYTSIMVLPLIICYFMNKRIGFREKILSFIMFLILIVSINFNYINYIWHGFNPPCAVNGRFTFMFILFGIYICLKSLINYNKNLFKYFFSTVLSIIYLLVIYILKEFPTFLDLNTFLVITILYFSLMSISLYIKNKNNKLKIYLFIFIGCFCISFLLLLFNIINISYFFRLLLIPVLVCLIEFIIKRRDLKFINFLHIYLIFLILLTIYLIFNSINLLGLNIIIKLLILCMYLLIFKYINVNKKCNYLLVIFVLIELLCSSYYYLYRFEFKGKLKYDNEDVVNYIKKFDDSKYFRIDHISHTSNVNDSILFNYYGTDYFMSSIKKDFVNLFIRLGAYNGYYGKNLIHFDGSYHLLSTLINVKYFINDTKEVENAKKEIDYYEKIHSIDDIDIYKNDDSLGFGYMVNSKIKDLEESNNGLQYINDIYKYMNNGSQNILDKVDFMSISNGKYRFFNSSNRDFYILIDVEDRDTEINCSLNINGNMIMPYKRSFLYKVNNDYNLDEYIDIFISLNDIVNEISINDYKVYIYYYDEDVYKEYVNLLSDEKLEVKEIDDNGLYGTINTKRDGILFLSFLYNDDLELYVDGKLQDKIKILDTFIGVKLDKGKHEIKLKYNPRKLLISYIPSLIGIGSLIVLGLKKKDLI